MCSPRGGAPVGILDDLDRAEALAVLCLRLWCDGARGQGEVARTFAKGLGEDRAASALEAFAGLLDLCVRYGRRPLMHHKVGCRCLGADEACFANFLMSAAEEEREDAMLLATLMVRADAAPILAEAGRAVGLTLRSLARGPGPLAARLH
jgi:hypothetical protein